MNKHILVIVMIMGFLFFKTSVKAMITFERTYGGINSDLGYSVQQTQDGGYIIAGETESYGAGLIDVYLIKTDSLGDTLWTRTFGGTSWDYGRSVAQTSDGGYIITGYTWSYGAGYADVYLIKTDPLGNTLWTRTFGGIDGDVGYSIQQTSDGGYIITGKTNSYGAGSDDVYLIKTDTLGLGIHEKEEQRQVTQDVRFTCHPNPFTTVTSVNFLEQNKNRIANLEIYDASGRLVKSVKLTSNSLQLGADLLPGIYFLKLKPGEYTATKKLIKIY